jgi:hypothetical protein
MRSITRVFKRLIPLTLGLSATIIIVLTAFAATSVTSASAESCFQTWETGKGAYTTGTCSTGGPPLEWVWGSDTWNWTRLNNGAYCVKVKAGLPSWWRDAVCSLANTGVSEYTKVHAQPAFLWGINPFIARDVNIPVFHFNTATVECTEVAVSGKATAEKAEAQILAFKYSGCTVSGSKSSATVSEAEYEFTAGGKISVVKKNIAITIPKQPCGITISLGGKNTALSEINYKNTEPVNVISAALNVSGINYKLTGEECAEKELQTNGTYTNEIEIEQKGVSVEVKLFP